jgi:hypothetical protein
LGESENVVDEQKHVLVLLVSEVLSNGQTGKTDTGTGTWGLVHLTVHEGSLGAGAVSLDDTRVNHFVVQIVTFTGTLTDTGEDGETTVSLSDVVNKLHDKHGLADTGTTEETNLTSLSVRSQKINNLDTSHQDLGTGTLINEGGGISVDGSELVGSDGATLVNGLTNHIDNSAESFGADGHQNGGTGVVDGLSTDKTFSGVQSNSSDVVTTQVLSDLEHESVLHTLDFKSVENWRESTLELHVDDGTNNLRNLSLSDLCAEAT